MSRYFYIDGKGNQLGPVEKERLMSAGITPETLVWGENMQGWQRAVEVPEIAAMFWKSEARAKPEHRAGQRYDNSGNYKSRVYNQYEEPGVKPSTYLWLGICTTILCCLPFGIVSIVYGAKVDTNWFAGRYAEAYNYSNKAKNWGIAAAVTAGVVFAVYLIAGLVVADKYSHF